MYHKISEMIGKVEVIYQKSKQLHEMKYGNQKKTRKIDVDFMIKDIQTLCREIANDTSKYKRTKKKIN
jgi:hypothetical protein|tara:strand:- start:487 stop:690 length:204 start_codon:yes stop_codon:yes gene_type:complete